MSVTNQDVKAEQGVLAAIFDVPEDLDLISSVLKPEDFFEPRHEIIYAAMLELAEQGKSYDPISLAADLRRKGEFVRAGGVEYFSTLTDPGALYSYDVDILGYAFIVKDESTLRQLKMAARKIDALGELDSGHSANEAVALAESIMRNLADISVKADAVNAEDAFDEIIFEIKARAELPTGAVQGVPSGFIDLDRLTMGWQPGQFIIVAGRPAMGKALALTTRIPTPSGWTTMGELEIGDEVFSPSGNPTKVVALSEIFTDHKCYSIKFSDGSVVVADESHEFPVIVFGADGREVALVMKTKTIAALIAHGTGIYLPRHNAVRYNKNGDHVGVLNDPILRGRIGLSAIEMRQGEGLPVLDILTSSMAERAAFIDAITTPTPYRILFPNPEAVLYVREICLSLGINMEIHDEDSDELYVSIDISSLESKNKSSNRYITCVTEIPSVPVRCIQVDDIAHMYLCDEFIPTHNSTLALDFARNAAFRAGKSVLFFSLEMSKKELMQKLLSAEARVELSHIRSGELNEEEWVALLKVKEQIKGCTLIFDDTATANMSHIRTVANRQAMRPEGLDLIVIDYLQLMESGGKVESRQQEVSEISRGSKILAKELHIPIISLSQLNRGSEQRADKKPAMSDLRESGSLEQDADIIILVHRPEAYDPNDRPGQAFADLTKHRGGPTKEIPLIPLLQYSKFANATGIIPPPPLPEIQDGDEVPPEVDFDRDETPSETVVEEENDGIAPAW